MNGQPRAASRPSGFQEHGMFSDMGDYDGKPGTLAVACFLIIHPKSTLLGDTGLLARFPPWLD